VWPLVLAQCLILLCVTQVGPGRCHTSHPDALDGCTAARHWPPDAAHVATALAATPCLCRDYESTSRSHNRLHDPWSPIKFRLPSSSCGARSTTASAIAAAGEHPAPLAFGADPHLQSLT
jgi:hypothetical protein